MPSAYNRVPYTDSFEADLIHTPKADCERCKDQSKPPADHLLIDMIGMPKFFRGR